MGMVRTNVISHFFSFIRSHFFHSIELEIRRISTTATTPKPTTTTTTTTTTKTNKSAEADHRRQAVIAAAEAREKAHKAKSKPIKSVTKTTLAREKQLATTAANSAANAAAAMMMIDSVPRSEEARRAAEAAKQGEAQLARQLGYNPYETARATAGQARTATTTAQHGSLSTTAAEGRDATAHATGSSSLPVVAPPRQAMQAAADQESHAAQPLDDNVPPPPPEFDEAFATLVSASSTTTSTSSSIVNTCSIIQKLVLNATTKGQNTSNPEEAAKFRKVRLANPKIRAALVDVPGAMDIMLLAGFQLGEQQGESVLLFPITIADGAPEWWPAAVEQLTSIR
jgi:hypothetical protein